MEILKAKQGQLTNYEVYSMLSDVKLSTSKRYHIEKNCKQCLESNVCSYLEHISPSITSLQSHHYKSFLNDMKTNFQDISDFELIQMMNLMPTSIVELYLIILNCDQRYTESDLSHMLTLVNSHLHPVPLLQLPDDYSVSGDVESESVTDPVGGGDDSMADE